MAFDHFVAAQAPIYETALGELKAGRKTSHWMWFVFPQIEGLGRSPMAQRYALHSLDEAAGYLAHPVLGERLRECSRAVLAHRDKSAHAIFGLPDDLKFHSSMTLFHRAAPDEEVFQRALEAFFDGEEDSATLARI
ncbi:DUF1810 domain-containing protein [Jiella marina]|uniref:DUF1810 domain-containing protein n=1 Tax=Jiella sp. LLJ827 TaxID=2917712 RepID=UPI0021014798|nr:DUF1810 domain-containing protein [Jiella sp. LLJ827]MCQ0990473.1 DUF1810 domain-containing protein [Jiella sp. LLJ827]